MRRRSIIHLAMISACLTAGCDVERDAVAIANPTDPSGAGGGSTGNSGAGGGTASKPLGDLPVVELEAGGCVTMTATAAQIYGEDSAPLYPDRLAAVDGRWLAASSVEDGFVMFDDDGSNAGDMFTPGVALHRVASLGEEFAVAWLDNHDDIELQLFDADGGAIGPDKTIAQGPATALALTAGEGGMLVAWSREGFVELRAVDPEAKPIAPSHSLLEEPMIDGVTLAATSVSDGHALTYAGAALDGWRVRFAFVGADGTPNEPVDIVRSDEAVRIVDLVALGNEGFALYLAGGPPDHRSFLVRLDAAGYPVGPALELSGMYPGWDVAVSDSMLALVAPRADGAPAMRVFDHELAPLGSWICLAERGDGSLNAAIATDGEGFAVAFAAGATAEVSPAVLLATLDEEGTPL